MKSLSVAMVLICALYLSSCSYRVGDFTVASTRNVEIGEEYTRVAKSVEGIDRSHVILFFPLGMPNLEDAIDNALANADGDLMTNVSMHYIWWYIPLIYGQYLYKVKGDVWQKPENGASLP